MLVAEVFPIEISLTLHGPADFAGVAPELLRAKVRASAFTRVVSLDGLRHVAAAWGPDDRRRLVYIPLGVDLSQFTRRPERRSRGPLRIVCVARLEPVKGHSLLLDAFARVAALGQRVELLLVGDGRLRDALQHRIRALGLQDIVVCTGIVSNDRLPSLLRDADVFALASRAEGLPVALMEAMACGLACVATWVNGVPELITHGQTGLMVPPSDIDALTDALTTLISSPRLRPKLGAAARRRVALDHDAVINADRMAAALVGATGSDDVERGLLPLRLRRGEESDARARRV